MMKNIKSISFFCSMTVLLLIYGCNSYDVFQQASPETNRRDREATEIAYITECVKTKRSVDNLIEWKRYGKNETPHSYEYKSSLVFFNEFEDTRNAVLKSIEYYHNSFQKMIFTNETEPLSKYEITEQTQFKVWMSKDKLSIYFCMINSDSIMIWVLTNGNWVYSSLSAL